jgi:hypothetical protein
MADVIVRTPKRRGWLRILGWTLLVLLLLVIVLYFVATSSAFFKGVILPRVSRSLNANITVADASLSPFSSVVLHKLKVQTTGSEPLVTAEEVRAVYHLGDIIRGNYHIEDLTLSSPVIQIITNPDGTSNLDPILQAIQKPQKPAQPAVPAKPSAPQQIDIKKMALNNATIRTVQNHKDGAQDVTEIANANLALDNLKNGQTGKMTFASDLKLDNRVPAPGTNSLLQAKAVGAFNLALAQDLKSATINGNGHFDVQTAQGAMSDLTGLVANLDCDITPTDIKQVALRFQKGGNNLGLIRATGPFDMAKTEGHLMVEIASIDRQVLNLIGAKSGTDFGSTTINSTNQIDLAKGGSLVGVLGQLRAANMTLTKKDLTTPTVDLRADYNVTVNRAENSALLRTLTMDGTQNHQPLLHAELTSPMSLAWGASSNAVGDSALKMNVTRMNLAEWKSVLDGPLSAGNLNLTGNLVSQQGGKNLAFDLTSTIDGLAAQLGSNQISQAAVNFQLRGQAADLNKFNLSDLRLELARQGQSLLTVSGAGQYEKNTEQADLQLVLNAMLPGLFQALSQPDIAASAGTMQVKAHVVRQGQIQTVTGNLALADFTGTYGKYRFDNYGVNADFDTTLNDQQLQIRKAAGTLRQGTLPGGRFETTGNYDLSKKSGQLALTLADMNENGLRPFLTPSLGEKRLVSASVNATSNARYDAQGASSLKADFQLANLVVSDPKARSPGSPLAAKFQVDASLQNKIAEVRQFQLNLTPTAQAANQLTLTGTVDMSQTNAIQGNLKLVSEAMDVTPYYDLLENKSKTTTTAASPSAPAPSPAPSPAPAANTEPPAVHLPFRNFSADVNIGRFYLREVAITNWQATAKFDDSHALVKPCQLTLNGAPVNATIDLNLGVPGYQYDIAFSADKVPLAPLANSFSAEYKGKAQGELIANVQVKGAGTTGTSLQKTLAGQASLTFTNANIQLAGPKAKMIITPIALALRLPELTQSPINWLVVDMKIGNGVINLTQLKAVGPAFTASSQGTITIANVLTNSPINDLPVNIALAAPLAKKARLAPANLATNTAYVDLGRLARIGGTIGDPKTKEDTVAIGLLTARAALGGYGGPVGGEAGKVLKGIGGLGGILSGQQPADTNAPPPANPPATNQPGKVNPFDLFKKVLPK